MKTSVREKNPGGPSLRGPPTHLWNLPLGTQPDSHGEDLKKIPYWLWQEIGKNNLYDIFQRVVSIQWLTVPGERLSLSLFPVSGGHSPTPALFSLPVSLKGKIKK